MSVLLNAQMPDWKFFKDREGNGYYYDPAMKIRVIDAENFEYRPVSRKGVDYYLNTGIELIKTGRYPEGLFYLKSLRMIPALDRRMKDAAADASKWINYLYKKHGSRFERYNKDSTVLLTFYDGKYNLVNEKLRYRVSLTKRPWIIKNKWKYNDTAHGLKFGINFDNNKNDNGFDCVAGIESRISKGKLRDIDEAVNSWRYELGSDNFRRQEITRKNDRILFYYSYEDGVPFSGIEAVYINGEIFYILRVIFHNDLKEKVSGEIKKSVEDLILIN